MCNQSSDQDLSLEDEKAKKADRPFSSRLSETIQMKKNLAMTYPSREKFTFAVSGKLDRKPPVGTNLPEHKTKDHSSGKPDPMPQFFSALCRQIASTK